MSKKEFNDFVEKKKSETAEKKQKQQSPKEQEIAQKVGNRYRVQFDIFYPGDPGKTPDPVSATVPDMTLTVRQLLENHSRGRDSNVIHKEPLYFETEIPTLRDITDVKRYREQLELRKKEVDKWIKKETDEKKAAEEKKAKIEEMAKPPIQPNDEK